MKRIVHFCFCVVLLISTLAFAQNQVPSPGIQVTVLDSPRAPIRINSWLQGTEGLRSITFTNVSGKAIQAIQFGWIAHSPGACVSTSDVLNPFSGLMKRQELKLDASKQVTLPYGFAFEEFVNRARNEGRAYLDIQIVPVGIDFSDGSNWVFNLPEGKVLDQKLFMSVSRFCDSGRRLTNQELKSRNLVRECNSTSRVQSYSSKSLEIIPNGIDPNPDCIYDYFAGEWVDVFGNSCYGGGTGGGGGETNPGHQCVAEVRRMACGIDMSKNTCLNQYCPTNTECAMQRCTPIP